MQRSQIIKTWLLTLTLAAGMSLGQSALADPPPPPTVPPSGFDLGCDNGSLEGVFSIMGQVFFVPPEPPPALPFTTGLAIPAMFINVTEFDGQGNLITPTGLGSNGGAPGPVSATGTYAINPDCTGELHIVQAVPDGSPVPPEVHAWITILDKKDGFNFIFTDPGVTGSGTGQSMN